jgi:DNA replication and repair protein RecF
MHLTHLSLTNFRNFARLELDLGPGATLLVGDNAQGKSNLLEAVGYLATARSFRAGAERELIHWLAFQEAQPFARVVGQVEKGSGPLKAEIVLVAASTAGVTAGPPAGGEVAGAEPAAPGVPNGPSLVGDPQPGLTKRLRLNGAPKRAADFVGQVNVVGFSPEDLELIAGSPSLRRRYLDVLLAQVDHLYYRALSRYNKVLVQRNHLLRLIAARQDDPAQLQFWNDELVTNGAYLTTARQAAVHSLTEQAAEVHRDLTGGMERLQVLYRPSVPPGDGEVAERFHHELKRCHHRELHQGVSLVGPHRDDLTFLADGVDMHTYGSRGQQRTVALSLKLAEVATVRTMSGEEPILLLDDIMSELDPARRAWLLAAIAPGQQVVLTATETEHFTPEFLMQATVWRVKAGAIV